MQDFYVGISPYEAKNIIKKEIVSGSITGELIDEYTNGINGSATVDVLVFEKHYYRAGNRLTLTVVIDNFSGSTHIHTVGGGGGEGLFRFDWGASSSFEDCVEGALRPYIIR